MTIRRTLLPFVIVAMLLASCAKENDSTSASPAASASLNETTIGKCVNDKGDTPPAKATGTDFTTIAPGVLRVGSDTAFPPFESIEQGKPVGFDVDLITEIAKRLKLRADVQTAVFDTIFTALAAKKYDAVISGVTIRVDRKKTVDFTDSYFLSDQSLAVKDGSPITGIDDLKGKVVGVQSGTTGETCAKTALKAAGKAKDVRSYDTAPDAFTDLAAGRIDAVLNDLPTSKAIVEQRSGVKIVQVVKTSEDYGIAVAKSNPNLRVAIDNALKAMKGDGSYRRLYVKWFKTEPPT